MKTIAELRKIAEGATPGNWRHVIHGFEDNVEIPLKDECFDYLNDLRPVHSAHIATFNPQTCLALLDDLEKCVEALEYYSEHESVIKEAYHSNDKKQITCVHTFINHKAREALAGLKAGKGGEGER